MFHKGDNMIIYDVSPSASYIIYRNIERLKTAAFDQWDFNLKDVNEVGWIPPSTIGILRFYFNDGTIITQEECQSLVNIHNNALLTIVEQNQAQTTNAITSLNPLLTNLSNLSAEDAAYALMGRAMALKDGASQITISGIIDRATAASYLQNKIEWINLPATAKSWLVDHLDMEAMLFQSIIVTLRQ